MKIGGALLKFVIAGALTCAMGGAAIADEGERPFPPVDNEAYKHECSTCHFLYQPGLLPERSWDRILKESGSHFGENLGLDEKTVAGIAAYLKANSADKGVNEWAQKIRSSVGATTPLRITETPYIQRKHREIKAEVFKRPSIQSFSNCGACHKKAAEGDFEEDSVSIPK